MTDKEALDWLISRKEHYEMDDDCQELAEAIQIGINAIEQKPCEDAISRQKVNILVDELARAISDERCCMPRGRSTGAIMQDILDLPPVTPETKTGHWIKYGAPRCGEQHYKCTSCGYYINFGQWGELYTKEFKYCPNCMAKMLGAKNEVN